MRLVLLLSFALGPAQAVVAATPEDLKDLKDLDHHRGHRVALLRDAEPIPEGFTPRFAFALDASHRPGDAHHAKRDGTCGTGKHDCLDVNHPERCCANDSYCYISKDNEPKCCPIGSNCVDDSYCSSQAYFCTSTATTSIHTVTRTSDVPAATAVLGCCARACPQTSYYLCPQSLGGNCCPFGSDCHLGGKCVGTVTATETPSQSLSPETPCATGQVQCADGLGCCGDGLHCTQFRGTGYCASPAPLITPISTLQPSSPSSGNHSSSSSSSSSSSGTSGKTIGLAVGLSLGVSLIIAILAWFFLHIKRERASLKPTAPVIPSSSPGPGDPETSSQTTEPWYPDQDQDQDVQPEPAMRVLHEPNGPGAAPVEIDSTVPVEVEGTEVSGMSPMSQRSRRVSGMSSAMGRGDENRLSVTATSWLQLSPTTPTTHEP